MATCKPRQLAVLVAIATVLTQGQVYAASCGYDGLIDGIGNSLVKAGRGQEWRLGWLRSAVEVVRPRDGDVRADLEAVAHLDNAAARVVAEYAATIYRAYLVDLGEDNRGLQTVVLGTMTANGGHCEWQSVLKVEQGAWRLVDRFQYPESGDHGQVCSRAGMGVSVWSVGTRKLVVVDKRIENFDEKGRREKPIYWGVERSFDDAEIVKRSPARERFYFYDPLHEPPEALIGRIDLIYAWRGGTSFLKDVAVTHADCNLPLPQPLS